MNLHHQPQGDDPTLGFKIALNELLRFPHVDGNKAIEVARRALEVNSKVTPALDFKAIKKARVNR